MKLTKKGSFTTAPKFNRVPAFLKGIEVGTIYIHRKRAWSEGRNSYHFVPNEIGRAKGLTERYHELLRKVLEP